MNGLLILIAAIAGYGIRRNCEKINNERKTLLSTERAEKAKRERIRAEAESMKCREAMWKEFNKIKIDEGEVQSVMIVAKY